MNTGEKIKSARKAQSLTQQELADRIGVNRSAIAKYENDMVKTIPRDIIEKLMKELDLTPADFFDFSKGIIKGEKGTGKTQIALNVAKQVIAQQREITDQEEALLQMYRLMNDENKSTILEYATNLLENQQKSIVNILSRMNAPQKNNKDSGTNKFINDVVKYYLERSDNKSG